MLTLVPATQWGFADRGLVREGLAADLVVFDPDTIAPEMPEVAHDLPAGARRLVQRGRGIAATVVNGEVLLRDGKHTGALPGRLLRGPLARTGLSDRTLGGASRPHGKSPRGARPCRGAPALFSGRAAGACDQRPGTAVVSGWDRAAAVVARRSVVEAAPRPTRRRWRRRGCRPRRWWRRRRRRAGRRRAAGRRVGRSRAPRDRDLVALGVHALHVARVVAALDRDRRTTCALPAPTAVPPRRPTPAPTGGARRRAARRRADRRARGRAQQRTDARAGDRRCWSRSGRC